MLKRDKKSNIAKILHTLWVHNSVSRVQIARIVGLDKSTVTNIVNEFIESGLIRIVAEGEAGPQGGRKPVMLTLNPAFGVVFGVEVQADFYKVSAVDLAGELHSTVVITNSGTIDFDTAARELIVPLTLRCKEQGYTIIGMGVGLPGVVDPFSSILQQSIPLKVREPLLLHSLNTLWPYGPVMYENDAKCCAWGELAIWRSKNIKDFLTVLIELNDTQENSSSRHSLAVGVAVVIDGKVHHGKNFSAGEFRSILWNKSSTTQFSFSKEKIVQLRTDKQVRIDLLSELANHLAFLVNMFNLSHIFFGGDTAIFEDDLPEIMYAAVNKNWPYEDSVECEVSFVSHGQDAVSYGAASMVLNTLFNEDQICSNRGDSLPMAMDFLTKGEFL